MLTGEVRRFFLILITFGKKFQGVQQLYLLLSEENVYIERQVVEEKKQTVFFSFYGNEEENRERIKTKKDKEKKLFCQIGSKT